MTEHDSVRRDRALAANLNDIEEVRDALRGLQSTDDPSLCGLAEMVEARLRELKAKEQRGKQ